MRKHFTGVKHFEKRKINVSGEREVEEEKGKKFFLRDAIKGTYGDIRLKVLSRNKKSDVGIVSHIKMRRDEVRNIYYECPRVVFK